MGDFTYKLMENGVLRSDGACIPPTEDNRDWRRYLRWLDEGNTPEPQYTEAELQAKLVGEEVANLKADLKKAQVWQFRMIVELWKVCKQLGATNADVDPDVLAKAQAWIAKLDRLKEIDE